MNVVLSDTLVAQHPDTTTHMAQIIAREESDDLLTVVTAPSFLSGRKTISWQLAGPPTEGSKHVDVSRIAFWIDITDIEGPPATLLEEDLQRAQQVYRSLMVLFLGCRQTNHDAFSSLVSRFQVRYKAHCVECPSIQQALEHLYRISLYMNPYHVVKPHAPLYKNDHQLTYLRMLLQLEGVTVPQVKHITHRYPTWRRLIEHLECRKNDDFVDDADDGVVPAWVWKRLMNTFDNSLDTFEA
ncbi:hypothetical protein V5O48_005800 [Marasmius crinis-equi]|uniref:Uncharacterized protein n=1 Tax=Marasmius crinis-equi TaxID=585013 RepID=A0ABR3FL99_9AGAR